MNIKLTNKLISRFLKTDISPEDLATKVSLSGPTFDRVTKITGDYLFEIEAITNRVDTACAFGVAREANAILNQYRIPSELQNDPAKIEVSLYENLPETIQVNISNKQLSSRYCAVTLSGVKINKSDKDTQFLLSAVGERPINNAVDITNELTLTYGFPLHILDLDKIKGSSITIRESVKGEKLHLLDDSVVTLKGGDIVAEDGDHHLIDLCGIMGGTKAEVDNKTTNILLIVPQYNPRKIRQTSLYLQKRTLAAQIYEKQPDTELCLPVLTKAIEMFIQRCSAQVSGRVFDYYPEKLPEKVVDVDLLWLNSFIGIDIARESVIDILSDLGFSGKLVSFRTLSCKVPSWRHYDINIQEDLAEEIARVYGYYKLPSVLPTVDLPPSEPNKLLSSELNLKKFLAALGYTEIFNNSLISAELINKSSLKLNKHLKLVNALSVDFEYLRISLLPSLLSNLKQNLGKVDGSISLFEIANIYIKQPENALPEEKSTLSLITTDSFLKAKGILEAVFRHLNTATIDFHPLSDLSNTPFEMGRSAIIKSGKDELGIIGHIRPEVLHNLEIKADPVCAEISVSALISTILPGFTYTPISTYPPVMEEITIESGETIGSLIKVINNFDPLITSVIYLKSYKSKHSFKLTFSSTTSNLDQKTVETIKNKLIKKITEPQ